MPPQPTSLVFNWIMQMAVSSPTGATAAIHASRPRSCHSLLSQLNTWYRFEATITKLTDTSARIDVSLVELDGSGNPTGTPYTGTVDDTSTWPDGVPADKLLHRSHHVAGLQEPHRPQRRCRQCLLRHHFRTIRLPGFHRLAHQRRMAEH